MSQLACQKELERDAKETQAPRFTCYLDDYPDHLVPTRYLDSVSASEDGERLIVNPDLFFARLEDLPVGMLDPSLLDNFEPDEDMIWVRRSGMRMAQPFWLRPKFAEIVSKLMAGECCPDALSYHTRTVLKLAHVLIDEGSPAAEPERREGCLDAQALQFREMGYAPVSGLIHPLHLAALRRYYRKLIRLGRLRRGDSQSDRYVAHNERVARLFHRQLAPAISAIVGEAVKPSYVYSASYQSGARLEKHTDREQCEFSLTFCLDYSPEPLLQTPWPLRLHTDSSMVMVFQNLGDGLVYRGREIPHSRDALPHGHTSTSIFFHYVRDEFEGSLD